VQDPQELADIQKAIQRVEEQYETPVPTTIPTNVPSSGGDSSNGFLHGDDDILIHQLNSQIFVGGVKELVHAADQDRDGELDHDEAVVYFERQERRPKQAALLTNSAGKDIDSYLEIDLPGLDSVENSAEVGAIMGAIRDVEGNYLTVAPTTAPTVLTAAPSGAPTNAEEREIWEAAQRDIAEVISHGGEFLNLGLALEKKQEEEEVGDGVRGSGSVNFETAGDSEMYYSNVIVADFSMGADAGDKYRNNSSTEMVPPANAMQIYSSDGTAMQKTAVPAAVSVEQAAEVMMSPVDVAFEDSELVGSGTVGSGVDDGGVDRGQFVGEIDYDDYSEIDYGIVDGEIAAADAVADGEIAAADAVADAPVPDVSGAAADLNVALPPVRPTMVSSWAPCILRVYINVCRSLSCSLALLGIFNSHFFPFRVLCSASSQV
jgi:hypothetical protein